MSSIQQVRFYDNGGRTFDRYTALFMDRPERGHRMFSAIGMSEHPFHPMGFGQHCTAQPGCHLGRRIPLEQLPADCQTLVMRELSTPVEA